ncbi:hypothetical protein [Virgibacillus sp. DJP39]
MEQKPMHYDGTGSIKKDDEQASDRKQFEITPEMRKNISGNPYKIK